MSNRGAFPPSLFSSGHRGLGATGGNGPRTTSCAGQRAKTTVIDGCAWTAMFMAGHRWSIKTSMSNSGAFHPSLFERRQRCLGATSDNSPQTTSCAGQRLKTTGFAVLSRHRCLCIPSIVRWMVKTSLSETDRVDSAVQSGTFLDSAVRASSAVCIDIAV